MEPRVQLHASSVVSPGEAQRGEAVQPIQLPGPSVWPLLLGAAIVVCVAGLLFIDDYPWLSLVTLPSVFICILGWALEKPGLQPAPVMSQVGYTSPTAIEVMLGETFDNTLVSAYPVQEVAVYPVQEKEEIPGSKHETQSGDLSSRQKVPGRIRLLRY